MDITRESLIEEIRRVAQKLGRDYLSINEFYTETGISQPQVLRYFDRWNDAVIEAGLKPLDKKGRPDKVRGLQKHQLIERMKEVAQEIGTDYLTRQEFQKRTGVTWSPVYRLFPGGWIEALKTAGLKPHDAYKTKIPDEELFNDYFRITNELGRFPTYYEVGHRSKYSKNVYARRFGNFTEFRKHAIQWGMDKGLIKPEKAQPVIDNLPVRTNRKELSYNALDDRPVLGERIDFRSMVHAPINELGVVCLFGILSTDLGFTIESIQQGFPDCEAKRRLRNDRWQSVRIEFEYKSSHFLTHQHPITGCDTIVCWIHDWKECPLEVVELKSVLEKLSD